MITLPEIQAMQDALDRALVVVESAESEASRGRNVLGSIVGVFSTGPTFADDSASSSGLLAAASVRDLYEAVKRVRDRAVETDDGTEHEMALQVIELANKISGSQIDTAIAQGDSAASAPTIIASTLRETARQAQAFASSVGEAFVPTIRWVIVGLLAVAAIYIVKSGALKNLKGAIHAR